MPADTPKPNYTPQCQSLAAPLKLMLEQAIPDPRVPQQAQCYTVIKEKVSRFRVPDGRYNKLKLDADSKSKTIAQLIKDSIDRLPNPGV